MLYMAWLMLNMCTETAAVLLVQEACGSFSASEQAIFMCSDHNHDVQLGHHCVPGSWGSFSYPLLLLLEAIDAVC